MNEAPSAEDRARITAIVAALEAAWNAGDGEAFGAPMAADADFVTVRAEHFRGRAAIADGHTGIFRGVFARSRIRYTLDTLRLLRPDVALAHVSSMLDVPAGPLAGSHEALFSAVLVRTGSHWEIAAFHNTQAPPAGRPPG